MKKILLLFITLFISIVTQAQEHHIPQPPIPIEVMVGDTYSNYQMMVSKPFSQGSKFSFFNLTTFDVNYEEEVPNTYNIQTIGFYSPIKNINIGAGGMLTPFGGFKPLVAISYGHFTRDIAFLVQPTYAFGEVDNAEVFALFEWHPSSSKAIQPYFRVQGVTNWEKAHSISFHNWRVGAQYKSFRFGPAVNIKHIGNGELLTHKTSWGVFVNIQIH